MRPGIGTMVALLVSAGICVAQDGMSVSLRKGIVEEETKASLSTALEQYQDVLSKYAEARLTAATALFRIGECYRREGNRTQAVSAYERVIQEFSDQPKLVAQSRTILSTIYSVSPTGAADPRQKAAQARLNELAAAQKLEQTNIRDARARYRDITQQQIALLKTQIGLADERYRAGVETAVTGNALRLNLLQLQRDLAAFDAGVAIPGPGRGSVR